MWVVTHANHDSVVVFDNFAEPEPGNWGPNPQDQEAWDLPPIATYKPATIAERADAVPPTAPDPAVVSGYYDTSTVQPAALDGGIPIVAP
jgi:hypothetical protein